MMRKPQPKAAARLVRQGLAAQGITLTSRQSLDVVAVVEGHASWQVWQGALKNASSAPVPPVRKYDQAWALLRGEMQRKMTELHDCFTRNFSAQMKAKQMRLHVPILDEDADEYSSFMWLETGKGGALLTATMTLTEDDAGEGFSVKFELYAPSQDCVMTIWTATRPYGADAWVPFDELGRMPGLLEKFLPEEIAYVVQADQLLDR